MQPKLFTGELRYMVSLISTVADETRFANKEALQEIHRVLKPNGVLGLVWNIDDCKHLSPTSKASLPQC